MDARRLTLAVACLAVIAAIAISTLSFIDRDEGNYLMDHSSIVFLLGPDGRYVRQFSANTPPETMAAAIREVL